MSSKTRMLKLARGLRRRYRASPEPYGRKAGGHDEEPERAVEGGQVDVPALLAEITGRLEALPKRDAESLRGLRREVSPAIAAAGPRGVIDLAIELFRSGVPGSHVIAYELVAHHGSALSAIRAKDLRRLGAHMASWGEVDAFAGIAGPAWRSRQISDETVAGWTRSSNRWWRRAALVSTVEAIHRELRGDGSRRTARHP